MAKTTKTIRDSIREQKPNENIYITKYPMNEQVRTIILDFDDKDKDKVYHEVRTLKKFLRRKGVNSVIVSSTNKGYHYYIQTPPIPFDEGTLKTDPQNRNRIFVLFTKMLVGNGHFPITTLDLTNTHAGLRGNIRLLGSTHPKTGEKVHIADGEFIPNDETYYEESHRYILKRYEYAKKHYEVKTEYLEKKIRKNREGLDVIQGNDLRTILPNLYGGTVRKYNGYIFMQCPWHVDRNPSLMVTKEWYYCTGCGEKGNIWTLIKKGKVKP